ncbi:MAG: arginase family protein [Desulfobacter sp.]
MPTKRLNLLFPQWQGSGTSNALYHAAHAFKACCPGIPFTPVPVPETDHLEKSQSILGYHSILAQMAAAADIVETAAPGFILTVGGDCGIEPVPVSFLNRKHRGEFTLIWLDAHGDMNTPDTSLSGHFHGMPLATLMGLGDPALCSTCFSFLAPHQIILAGTRALDPAESQRIQDRGITQISVQDMEADNTVLSRIVKAGGNHPVYIHIDLDVLDPAAYPYIRHPEPGGLSPHTLAAVISDLETTCTVAGLGVMEFTLSPFSNVSDDSQSLENRDAATDTQGIDMVKSLVKKFK